MNAHEVTVLGVSRASPRSLAMVRCWNDGTRSRH